MRLEALRTLEPWEWPEDARDVILERLRAADADDEDLLLAAELGGDLVVVDDDLARALLDLLERKDASAEVRAKAAIAFGPSLEMADTEGFDESDPELGGGTPISEPVYDRIQKTLRAMYTDADVPELVRRRCLEASVRAPQPWHEGAVRAAWSSTDEPWKVTAAFCMRYVKGFDRAIVEALASQNEDVRYEAVGAAGGWGVDDAFTVIAKLATARDTKKELRIAAIEAAAEIRPGEAEELLAPLTEARDEDVAAAAEEAIEMARARLEAGDD